MNLPNSITMSRIACVPLLIWILSPVFPWQGHGATVVPALPRAVKVGLGAVLLAFWVARNLPGSWLAP